MALPVRSLPVLQNWDCHSCSDCCRKYRVTATAAEKERIEAQGWASDPELAGQTLFEPEPGGSYALAHKPGGGCVFLGPDDRCRIHAKFGGHTKPLACRAYPFLLVPTDDHWRVGIKFACPSAAANKGRPMSAHVEETAGFAAELEGGRSFRGSPPVPLRPGQVIPWADLLRIVNACVDIVLDPRQPIARKLQHLLAFVSTCRRLEFATVSGQKLFEMLRVLSAAAGDEVPADPAQVPTPGWVGRTVFRQLAAVYVRVDLGPQRGGMSDRGWLGRMLAGYRFAWGTGVVPPVNGVLPAGVRFEAGERPFGPLSPQSEQLLTRYFRVKIESLQFCGRINFDLPVWDGLDSLVVVLPVTLWLARLITTPDRTPDDAVRLALQIVDDSFGFNPLLGRKLRGGLGALANKGELPRLVAWYGR